jgi:hypothetical protein
LRPRFKTGKSHFHVFHRSSQVTTATLIQWGRNNRLHPQLIQAIVTLLRNMSMRRGATHCFLSRSTSVLLLFVYLPWCLVHWKVVQKHLLNEWVMGELMVCQK